MNKPEIELFSPANKQDWRNWLAQNHQQKEAVWLVIHKKNSSAPNLNWSDAVDEALCFGWIDSVRKTIDNDTFKQYFGKRKANSTWSKINKDKVELFHATGLMTEAGIKCIDIAKKNGSWTILDAVDNLEIPKDLTLELNKHPNAEEYFLSLSKSVKKQLLYWIISAKRPETRQKRIVEIATSASDQQRPKQFR